GALRRGRTEELEGAGGRDVGARTFDSLYHSAVCRPARPTAVEPHGVSATVERLWAEYGRFASRDLSEFALIDVFVGASSTGCVSGNRARGAGRVRRAGRR